MYMTVKFSRGSSHHYKTKSHQQAKQLNLPCLVVSLSSGFSSLENGSTHDIVARMTPTNKEAFLVEKWAPLSLESLELLIEYTK